MKGKFYSYIFITGLQCNGTLLFRKVGSRAKYLDHGLVYRFSPLEPYEEEKISQNGMDQDVVLLMQQTFFFFRSNTKYIKQICTYNTCNSEVGNKSLV